MSRLHRALVGALATTVVSAGLVGVAAPATAADSTTCVFEGSTRLLTANDGDYKVWLDPATTSQGLTEYTLCFGANDEVRGALVFRFPVGGTLVPSVVPDATDDNCPRLLHVQDPVELMTRFGETLGSSPGYVCFGLADEAVRLTVTLPAPVFSPNVELALDPRTIPWNVYCSQFPTNSNCFNGTAVTINVI